MFNVAKIQHFLHMSYEFRKSLFDILSLIDLSNAVRRLELTLTEKENATFLHPLPAFPDFDMLKKLMDLGRGITAFGSDEGIRRILNSVLAPETECYRSQERSRGGCCKLLFSQPHRARLPTAESARSSVGTAQEFNEVENLLEGRRPSAWECSGFRVRTAFSYSSQFDVKWKPSGGTKDLTRSFWPTDALDELQFQYLHLHVHLRRYPFDLKRAEARYCWSQHIRAPGIHERLFVYPCFDGYGIHRGISKDLSARVPILPCCDNYEDQLLLSKSLKEQLGEKMDVGGCKCECHEEDPGELEQDFKDICLW